MNKTLKRVLIGIGIIIVIIVLFMVGFTLKFKSIAKQMHPAETQKVIDNIYSVKDGFVNMFLIQDSDKYVAIDAGYNLNSVSVELKKLNINPDNIIAVFLTHTDRDHVAALKLFKNAKVYLSRQEEDMINGKKSKKMFMHNKIDTKVYTLLDDQQVLTFNHIKIKGYLTPGHTSGSMCYLVNDKFLFTGDILTLKEGKVDKSIKFFNMDNKLAIKSIDLITRIPTAEYIFSAHTGFTSDYQNAVKDWNNRGN